MAIACHAGVRRFVTIQNKNQRAQHVSGAHAKAVISMPAYAVQIAGWIFYAAMVRGDLIVSRADQRGSICQRYFYWPPLHANPY